MTYTVQIELNLLWRNYLTWNVLERDTLTILATLWRSGKDAVPNMAKFIDREDNKYTRWVKEAIWIRKSTAVMNRDEGGYKLSHVWDRILATTSQSGKDD